MNKGEMMKKKFNRSDYNELDKAKEAVNKKIGFYVHLVIYVCVNLFFHILNLREGGEYWAIYPLAFWGVGLGVHFLNVFDIFENSKWKNKQIIKQIEKQRKSNKFNP